MTLKRYHFDVGNSNDGPIGACAVVYAETKEEAVQILRDSEPDCTGPIFEYDPAKWGAPNAARGTKKGLDYIHCYFNAEEITVDHITYVEDADDLREAR